MAVAASDRMSDLPDDVIIYVLSFLASKEAARTTVLSRRWRCPLWLEIAVVNIDSCSYTHTGSPASDADHAFSLQYSHGRVPSKVTLVLHDGSMHDDILRAACRDKAAIEELRLDCNDGGWPLFWKNGCAKESCGSCSQSLLPMYALPPTLLPFAALRFLDLNGCQLKDVIQFPCLVALRLRLCAIDLATLQDMVSSAPVLADIRLESLSFTDRCSLGGKHLRLRCLAATAIEATNVAARGRDSCTIEIEAPRLRRFRHTQDVHIWNGAFELVSFKSPQPQGLELVDIEVGSPAAPLCSILGIRDCHTRVFKLTVFSIADVVDTTGIFPNFPNLERLEIEELCGFLDDRIAAARAIMDMLHCCPVIRNLRLKFTFFDRTSIDPEDHAAAMSEHTPCKSLSEDGGPCCKVSYFPRSPPDEWLMDPWQKSLKKVAVRCDVEQLTCFQVQLIGFMARNAETLEEVDIIGAGSNRHIHRKVEEWRATPCTEGSLAERYIHREVEEWGATIWHRRPFREPPLRLSSFPPLPSSR